VENLTQDIDADAMAWRGDGGLCSRGRERSRRMEVRYGALRNVDGTPARSGGQIFIPAYAEVNGRSGSLDNRLHDQ
jgi:hypothetical protein